MNQSNYRYILNANISSAGTCFIIGADNITLEGQRKTVNYSTANTGYGINDNGGYDNIIIKNLTLIQQSASTNYSHGIYFKNVTNSRLDNIDIKTKAYSTSGIYLSGAYSNTFYNLNISTSNTVSYGSYMTSSNSNYFSGFNITTSGNNSNGIFMTSSNYNNYSNSNVLTSGNTAHGIYIKGNYNNFSNNIISGNGYGIYIDTVYSNTIRDGSIMSKITYDYRLDNSNTTNNFINTNFTTRKIYYLDNKSSFNYVNNSILLNTTQIISPSSSLGITRKLINWNQTNVSWQETVSSSRRLNYGMSGLLANSNYRVWNGSIISYNLTTDINGNLPVFSINFTTAKVIKILLY